MISSSRLLPRRLVPPLTVRVLDAGHWSVHGQPPGAFALIVFYRGLHCPICANYLGALDRLAGEFARRRTAPIAISTDCEQRAAQAKREWNLKGITLGYALNLETARAWGLYVSSRIERISYELAEPKCFVEPALFLVRAEGTLYGSWLQTTPFARPRFEDLLEGLDFVLAHDYPARGEVSTLETCS